MVADRPPESQGSTPAAASVEDAWRVLALVTDWIKHAEAKAGVCLAAAGFIGGVLFQLVAGRELGTTVRALAVACAVGVGLACLFSGLSLWPRLRNGGPPTSVIYFDHIARDRTDGVSSGDAMISYVRRLHTTLTDSNATLAAVGAQVWANARVARRKYRWAGWALLCMLLALGALGATAVAVIV